VAKTIERDRLSSEEIVKLLPEIIATAEQFDARVRGRVVYKDLLNQADNVLAAVEYFADEELKAVAPSLVAGAGQFEESSSLGIVAMGRLMLLDIINEHPELLRLAAQRARDELWQALHHGTVPARLRREEGDTSAE
jgi:hypothetical protein